MSTQAKLVAEIIRDGVLRARAFYCPGCEEIHIVTAGPGLWEFSGTVECPTFSPSFLVTSLSDSNYRCHSFIRDGRIQFLGDCSHALKGQTILLPAIDQYFADIDDEKEE